MGHPSNEPGKTYDVDDRRRAAALAACDGLPTEWLERGFISELYKTAALISLCDYIAERKDGDVRHPAGWWQEHIRGHIDALNAIASSGDARH